MAKGFASMDKEKLRDIARKGGKAGHELGRAHKFTSEEAREAGKKGGKIVSKDHTHMRELGQVGGVRSVEAKRKKKRLEEARLLAEELRSRAS